MTAFQSKFGRVSVYRFPSLSLKPGLIFVILSGALPWARGYMDFHRFSDVFIHGVDKTSIEKGKELENIYPQLEAIQVKQPCYFKKAVI